MKRVTILLAITLMILPAVLKAQQVPLYSQYMMNKYLINPAFAGSEGYTSYNLTARQQWMGFGDANTPSTQALAVQTRVLQNSYLAKSRLIRSSSRKKPSGRVGLGGYVFNDRNGVINRTGLQATYAYHIPLGEGQLSFGASGSIYQFKIDDDELILPDDDLGIPDPLIDGRRNTMFIPDASAGMYYMYKNLYVGFSGTNLFQSVLKFGSDESYGNYKLLRNYYLMGGYRIQLDDEFALEPSLLVHSTENFNMQADINVKGYYKNDYWMGLSYRTGSALITMVGVKVGKLYFGYAYDYSLREIQNLSYGSHEIMLGLRFGDSQRRYRWLRRF
ncbi:MAG: type IX secretion system membrane protein PorP/SprF [Bacteroidales bacterium]|nr:type IX secretion system membrane protein PorP/SprF [Bacteroidales bacterium]